MLYVLCTYGGVCACLLLLMPLLLLLLLLCVPGFHSSALLGLVRETVEH